MTTPIVFEAYDGTGDGSGAGEAVLAGLQVLGVSGLANYGLTRLLSLTSYGTGTITRRGVGTAMLGLRSYGNVQDNAGYSTLRMFDTYGNDVALVPTVEVGVTTLPRLTSYGHGIVTRHGSGVAQLGLLKSVGRENANVGVSQLAALHTRGQQDPPFATVAIIQSAGYTRTLVSGPIITTYIDDGVIAADVLDLLLTISTGDIVRVRDAAASSLRGTSAVFDAVKASEFHALVFQLIAESALTVADDPRAYFNLLLSVADAAFATGTLGTNFTNALLYVAVVAELGDRADLVSMLAIADSIEGLDAAAIQRIGLMVAALDSVLAADAAVSTLRLLTVVDDAAELTETTGTSLEGLLEALDAGLFSGRLSVGGTSYSVYALTLFGQAPSEYTNFNFDSYATIGGRLYAVGDEGLVLCEGDSDDGTNIDASIRRGLSNLGTQLKKEVPYAYIGYTSTGSLVLETTTTVNGTKRVNRYKLNPVAKSAFSDNRFKISKGLQSVYWDFELKNLDGADFEVDVLKFWRLPLNRRK